MTQYVQAAASNTEMVTASYWMAPSAPAVMRNAHEHEMETIVGLTYDEIVPGLF